MLGQHAWEWPQKWNEPLFVHESGCKCRMSLFQVPVLIPFGPVHELGTKAAMNFSTAGCWGCTTRAVPMGPGSDGQTRFKWQERFVVPLPTALTSLVLNAVPDDAQFSGGYAGCSVIGCQFVHVGQWLS